MQCLTARYHQKLRVHESDRLEIEIVAFNCQFSRNAGCCAWPVMVLQVCELIVVVKVCLYQRVFDSQYGVEKHQSPYSR